MSNDNHRVIVRKGARQLTQNETEQIMVAANTVATALPTSPVSNPDTMFDQ